MLLKIFFARIIDVSLGTFRTILIIKGKIIYPAIIAFFEVIIWFYVAKEALLVKTNTILVPIAYALGYATGNLIGSIISKKIINNLYEIKIYYFNKKIINYLKRIKINFIIINNKYIIFYEKEKNLCHILYDINNLSKRCIIYKSEVRKNNSLQYKNIVL